MLILAFTPNTILTFQDPPVVINIIAFNPGISMFEFYYNHLNYVYINVYSFVVNAPATSVIVSVCLLKQLMFSSSTVQQTLSREYTINL